MNTEQLQTFVVLARCCSFTRAGQELGLSQPAVSRHVQRLEAELGVALIDRPRAHVRLTDAGVRLRGYAEEVLEGRRRLVEALAKGPAPLTGDLRIAASSTPGEFLVPGLVAGFTATNPRVMAQVLVTDSLEVAEQIRRQRADVGFTGVELPGHDLHHQEVCGDEVVLAVPEGHPFAGRSAVGLDELAGQPFLCREPGSGTQMSFLEAVERAGLVVPPFRPVMTLGTTRAIVSAVRSGFGIGLASGLALEAAAPGGPVAVRIAGLSLRRSLFLVVERERQLPILPAAFCTWVLMSDGGRGTLSRSGSGR
jgi:DNA-binding transcriptional LysR family regulator